MRRSPGLSLIEIIVVLGIILVLTAILLPVFARAKDRAQATVALNQLRQLGAAQELYAGDNNGTFSKSGEISMFWLRGLAVYIKSLDSLLSPRLKRRPFSQNLGYAMNTCVPREQALVRDPGSLVLFTEQSEYEYACSPPILLVTMYLYGPDIHIMHRIKDARHWDCKTVQSGGGWGAVRWNGRAHYLTVGGGARLLLPNQTNWDLDAGGCTPTGGTAQIKFFQTPGGLE